MDAMKTWACVAITAGVALILGGDAGRAQTAEQRSALTPAQLARIRQLGPDGFGALPASLASLVDGSIAAIVGRVVDSGRLNLGPVDNPDPDRTSRDGFVTYRIAIEDVLFMRPTSSGAPFAAGTVVELDQQVRYDSALLFLTHQTRVAVGDTCLLFLRDGPDRPTLLAWHVQFRRVPGSRPTVESLGPPAIAAQATPEWFGASVRAVQTPQGGQAEWASVLAEVRRLGALPGRQR
jgi:hypothetical protein